MPFLAGAIVARVWVQVPGRLKSFNIGAAHSARG